MPTKACEVCGKPFEYKPSQEQTRKTCSRSCGAVSRVQLLKSEDRHVLPVKPRRGATTPCPTCGTDVYRTAREITEGKRQYCSKACSDIGKIKEPVVKTCLTCGKTMTLKPSQGGLQYCSRKCMGVGITKRPMERSHNGRLARKDQQGYVMVFEPDHPNKSFHGWQYEHRLVAERTIGRYLDSSEHVHHINGIKDDNRPENLAVMDGIEHAALSARDYRDFIERELAELAAYRKRYGPLKEE